MYEIKVSSYFSAAHFLRNYQGKCENLHGHNWKVEIVVGGFLNSSGMIMDFVKLKGLLGEVLEGVDHKYLNDLDYFSAPAKKGGASSAKGGSASGGKKRNPSSEEIAHYIYTRIKERISKEGGRLKEVRVWETENSCAIYRK